MTMTDIFCPRCATSAEWFSLSFMPRYRRALWVCVVCGAKGCPDCDGPHTCERARG